MPKLSRFLSISALFLFAVVVHPQGKVVSSVQTGSGVGSGSGVGQNSEGARVSVSVGGGMIGGISSTGMSGVKGQPFSADVIEETDQYLADGNHIHRESHGKVFRDSEGRSRNENEIGSSIAGSHPFVHIQIFDPVQNAMIMLNPQNKNATVVHFPERSGAAAFRAAPRTAPPSPGGQPGMVAPPPAPVTQARLQGSPDVQNPRIERQHSREDLGTMEIEGFIVKGTRLTTTTPAGVMGNDKPMTSTTERWFSGELKTDLLTKSTTPESGQHVRRLVNIRSGDPDPLLFQVPADYTVKEQSQQ